MKRILKISIGLLIITLILHKLYNTQTLTKAKKTKQPILITSSSRNCQFENGQYVFTIPDCSRYKTGSIVNIIFSEEEKVSRDNTLFDTGFLNKKRLIVESIEPNQNIWHSPELWVGYIFLKCQGRKESLANRFLSLLDNESSYLIGRVSLGFSQVSSEKLDHLFKVTGMHDLASISGFHINLVVRFFTSSLKKYFGKRMIGLIALFISCLYLLFIGPKIPLVRAFFMLFMTVISNSLLYRQTNPIFSLFFIALGLIYSDISMISSVSFQLSFAATASIILFTKNIKDNKLANLHISEFGKNIEKKTDKSSFTSLIYKYILESIKISLYVQIIIIPLVLYHFHEFSIISLVVSVTLTWLVPGLIILGIFAFLIGLLEGNGLITELFVLPLIFLSKLFFQILNLFDNEIFLLKISNLAWWHAPVWWLIVLIALSLIRNKRPVLSLVDCLSTDPKGIK